MNAFGIDALRSTLGLRIVASLTWR
jgi:hypothetical protein